MKAEVGTFVKAVAGHDSNQIYLIIKCEAEYVYLVDGRIRLISNPKKKKLKHVQVINKKEDSIVEKLKNNSQVSNEEIKRAIKKYKTLY